MTRRRPLLLSFAAGLLLSVACSQPRPSSSVSDAPPAGDAPEVGAAELTRSVAASVCGALFRCCDDDLTTYFAPFRDNERLASFRDRLPPAATLDEAGCRAVLAPMLDIVPLGDWVRASLAGEVRYDEAAAGACLAALDQATCGQPIRDAVWDSTCFGFAAPSGGSEQRAVFPRTRGVGESCGPIRDGIGATFYGTCDPATAFCCYQEPGMTGCQFPFSADGPRQGTCEATAQAAASCSVTPPIKLCATGADCSDDSATCVLSSTAPLAIGAPCVDPSFNLLGACQDSFCDLFGSRECEALRANGETCLGGDECTSGFCDTVCKTNEICTPGTTNPPTDAGVDSMPDASPPDAPPTTSDERCSGAPALAAASSTSPLSSYTSRITGSFGASNDYNPLMASGLPPSCAFAYDARGKDVVYAVTLAPGERLKLRAELVDGKQAGIYLLDSCPGASWPDFDLSGACGSNEYGAGSCGVVSCDPALLDFRYPAVVSGVPTTTATFWLVIDQIGGDDSTGFVVDWRISAN